MSGPSPPPNRDTASRVQSALRIGGLVIAMVQGAALPLFNLLVEPDVPISLPVLALAGGMMGIAKAIDFDRRRKGS